MSSVEERLTGLGLRLPDLPPLPGLFSHAIEHNGLLYLSGKGPFEKTGRVGQNFSKEEARYAAQEVGLVLLQVMKLHLGSLDKVDRVLRVFGMVNATEDFSEHPYVIDGCSKLFNDVFGSDGGHARSAVGMASLPFGIPVEIECTVAII